jgi:hypothetical protein
MLSLLAQMEPCQEARVADAVEQASQLVGPTQDLVVISTRGIDQATTAEDSLSALIQPWLRRNSLRWINVAGPDLDRWASPDAADSGSAAQASLTASSEAVPAADYRSGGEPA